MIVLAGGDLVLRDRIMSGGSLVIEGTRIGAIEPHRRPDPDGATLIDVSDCFIVPGFVDVHVHGVEGFDTLDEGSPLRELSARLPRYGVTAFCPTTVACAPSVLRGVLEQVRATRASAPGGARVLPAHLESNFINPEFRGAQPASCLRVPGRGSAPAGPRDGGAFSSEEILEVLSSHGPDIGIVTLAPELPGGIDLVRTLAAAGHHVSLGHSGATFDQAVAAIEAGARHATHLFNRMPPLGHRAPGLAGAVLSHDAVTAELICDGYHVHPALCRVAFAAKGPAGVMAITDGTAGSGLPVGSAARLGGQRIRVTEHAALLDDGTLAGSSLTMDGAFRTIVTACGRSLVDASAMCSTTPARALGLSDCGVIAEGAVADLVVLDRRLHVKRTFVDGRQVYAAMGTRDSGFGMRDSGLGRGGGQDS